MKAVKSINNRNLISTFIKIFAFAVLFISTGNLFAERVYKLPAEDRELITSGAAGSYIIAETEEQEIVVKGSEIWVELNSQIRSNVYVTLIFSRNDFERHYQIKANMRISAVVIGSRKNTTEALAGGITTYYMQCKPGGHTHESIASFKFSDNTSCSILNDNRFVLWNSAGNQISDGEPMFLQQNWPELYPYYRNITAAFDVGSKYYIFLNNGKYIRFSSGSQKIDAGYPKNINENTWTGLTAYYSRIQSAFFEPATEKLFFFLNNNEYLRYDWNRDALDSGYPKPINENTWNGLETHAGIIFSALNTGGDITYFYTEEGDRLEFSHQRDSVIR